MARKITSNFPTGSRVLVGSGRIGRPQDTGRKPVATRALVGGLYRETTRPGIAHMIYGEVLNSKLEELLANPTLEDGRKLSPEECRRAAEVWAGKVVEGHKLQILDWRLRSKKNGARQGHFHAPLAIPQ